MQLATVRLQVKLLSSADVCFEPKIDCFRDALIGYFVISLLVSAVAVSST